MLGQFLLLQRSVEVGMRRQVPVGLRQTEFHLAPAEKIAIFGARIACASQQISWGDTSPPGHSGIVPRWCYVMLRSCKVCRETATVELGGERSWPSKCGRAMAVALLVGLPRSRSIAARGLRIPGPARATSC